MGDEQQYDETQTGDAKIRDLGREYFPHRLVMPGVFSALSCTLPGVCNALSYSVPGVCNARSCVVPGVCSVPSCAFPGVCSSQVLLLGVQVIKVDPGKPRF